VYHTNLPVCGDDKIGENSQKFRAFVINRFLPRHSKNEVPLLGSSIPVLGVKLKRG